MPDFGPNWKWIRDLHERGQAHTFIVVRADGSDSREYVLKRLKNVTRRERFDREIRACLVLDHPNVVRIVDFGTDTKARPYLVTEYCGGGALIEKPKPLGTTLEILALFRQVCAGAAYAQQNGVVHRDIKPDNIFLRENGTPVLGDFGICYIDENGTCLTMSDEVMGSRWYCAPELRDGRLRPGIPATAADVYSLGKVLYWMLSGGRVFDREDHREPEYQLGQDDPGAPEYELINQLLDRAIVQDPLRRFAGAQLLLEAVDGLVRVVRAGGHATTLDVPHRCLFCAQGEYKVLVNGLTPGTRLGRDYQTISNDEASSIFGWRAPSSPGHPTWIILVCESCGHTQVFRPDLAPESFRRWQRKG
jgi:serine/threonine protein kinase